MRRKGDSGWVKKILKMSFTSPNIYIINSISDLLYFRQLVGAFCFFRGQADKDWNLTTSLERVVVKRRMG